tara:strand:- start:92 stop:259 length:168 start_codon:yes stop_codon:yes gene_type:complete
VGGLPRSGQILFKLQIIQNPSLLEGFFCAIFSGVIAVGYNDYAKKRFLLQQDIIF